jgi:hypothetical protein
VGRRTPLNRLYPEADGVVKHCSTSCSTIPTLHQVRSFAPLNPTREAQPRGSTRLDPTRFADAPTRRDPLLFYAGPKAW